MSSIAGTPSAIQDIMETEAERTLWEVIRHHERPPYWQEGEGVGARLNRAARVITDGRITPNSDGSFTVEGSEGRTYRVAEECSCPQGSRYGRSKYCYHLVAVHLYIEWQKRLRTTPSYTTPRASDPDDEDLGNGSPIDDETLPLPLPPATPDERLAQATATAMDAVHRARETDRMPQEDRMPDDDAQYIPEPDEAPVAVAEPPAPTHARTLMPAAPQVADLEVALQTWTSERAIVQRFLKQELKANIDYYTLKIGGRESKPSLSKAGAEKVMGWLKMQASFAPDTGTWEMLGRPTEFVAYICTLRTRSGEVIGEGRGARYTRKDNDINKSIKMALKSAQIDAILRTGALSDVFTQDAEDMQDEPVKATPAKPSSQELRQRIWALVTAQAPQQATTREAVTTWIRQVTGYELVPDNYQAITRMLETRV